MALAQAEGIEVSEEKLKVKFAEMHSEGKIADDELGNVAGGCGEGEHKIVTYTYCYNRNCSGNRTMKFEGDLRYGCVCPKCGRAMEDIQIRDEADDIILYP